MSHPLRVLVVDDNADVLKFFNDYLDTKQVQSTCVQTAADALAAMDRAGFDAVIADVRLKGLSGISLLKSIGARGGITSVVMMSASIELLQECLSLGATDFLPKPFRLAELNQMLARIRERTERAAGAAAAGAPPPSSS